MNKENEHSNFINIFQDISNGCGDKKKRIELYFEEIKKQYENTLSNGSFNSNKDIDWIINIIRSLFNLKLTTKDERKKFIQWLFKNLIVQVDSLRLKYKEQEQEEKQQQTNRILLKLWEYQLQIIIRFEYLYLKEKLIEKKTQDSKKVTNINSIDNIVLLLQDVSFLMDSITNSSNSNNNSNDNSSSSNNNNNSSSALSTQGFINFLETVILPRYINELKDTLIKIYKLLEISKPKQLKKDKSSNNNNNIIANQLIIKDNPDIESTLNIDLNKDDDIINNNKKKRKDNNNSTNNNNNNNNNDNNISNPQQQQSTSTSIPKDLFKNRNIKNLNHFTMALSNPSKSFRTITTTTTISSSSSSSSSQQHKNNK